MIKQAKELRQGDRFLLWSATGDLNKCVALDVRLSHYEVVVIAFFDSNYRVRMTDLSPSDLVSVFSHSNTIILDQND